MIQGVIPIDTSDTMLFLMTTSCGISFASLFLSIVFCVETQMISSYFMVKRTQQLNNGLKKSREYTKSFMKSLSKPSEWHKTVEEIKAYLTELGAEPAISSAPVPGLERQNSNSSEAPQDQKDKKEIISDLHDNAIDETWVVCMAFLYVNSDIYSDS